MDIEQIELDLKKFSEHVQLVSEAIDRHRVFTPFLFGDGYPISVVLQYEDGRWTMGDVGQTYVHLAYMCSTWDIDADLKKNISETLSTFSIEDHNGELRLLVVDDQFGYSLSIFVEAIWKITGKPCCELCYWWVYESLHPPEHAYCWFRVMVANPATFSCIEFKKRNGVKGYDSN